MENNIKTICLDFYGLPGCGKSTISHLLANELRKDFKVTEPSYDMDHGHSVSGRLIRKGYETIRLLIRYPRSFFLLVRLIRDCGFIILEMDFYIHLLNISYKINTLNKNSSHFVIFDQGFWQSAVSLFYMKERKTDVVEAYKRMTSIVPHTVSFSSIYIQVDINTAIDRMDARKAAFSRIQLLDNNSMIKELRNQLSIMEDLPSPRLIVNSVRNNQNGCVDSILKKLLVSNKN